MVKMKRRDLEQIFELRMKGLTNREISEELRIPVDDLRTVILNYIEYRQHSSELNKKYNFRRKIHDLQL
jgi:orotate phosphoribosyltransferase-like protein